MTSISVQASESAIGVALNDFSTANPAKHFEVELSEAVEIPDSQSFPEGTVLYGVVTKVSDGQRGKRQGYFEFHPTIYKTSKGEFNIKNRNLIVKITHYQPLDKKEAVKKVATTGVTTVAGKVLKVPVLSQGVSFVKGAVNADEDENMLVGGVKQVYEDSPLSYVEKGESLEIHSGENVKLHFYIEE